MPRLPTRTWPTCFQPATRRAFAMCGCPCGRASRRPGILELKRRWNLLYQLYEWAVGAFWAVINLSPETINEYASSMGPWLYVVLFAIIFAETGLVVTPYLPGDSLLFAVGAVAATPGSPVHIGLTAALLVVAAVVGD